jgi:hypothetical protein
MRDDRMHGKSYFSPYYHVNDDPAVHGIPKQNHISNNNSSPDFEGGYYVGNEGDFRGVENGSVDLHDNCYSVMICLACFIPVFLMCICGFTIYLNYKFNNSSIYLIICYVSIALLVLSCIIFGIYFCTRKAKPGDQNSIENGFMGCLTCSSVCGNVADCGFLTAICFEY